LPFEFGILHPHIHDGKRLA